MKTIPKFEIEDEEREFWATHDSTDHVDWSRPEAVFPAQVPEKDEPVQVEEWPESFWRAFDGMPEDFERPTQVPPTRESLDL